MKNVMYSPALLIRTIFVFSTFMAPTLYAQALQSLSDDQLSEINGREGVLLSLDYYLNSDKTSASSTSGRQNTSFCSGSLADMNCRFSWQISNRGAGASHSGSTWANGEWLVYKDGYLSLSVNRLGLEASYLGGAVSAGTAYESWFNPNSFRNASGGCLLVAGHGVSDCSVAYIKAMPALRTHYPETAGSYSNSAKASTGYNDVRLGMQVSGLAVEYDNGALQGWTLNNRGSFAGLALRDNNGPQAGFAFGGSFYLYGF